MCRWETDGRDVGFILSSKYFQGGFKLTLLMEAKGISKHYDATTWASWRGERRLVKAVDHVDLAIHEGECFALVGESGCGKSTTAKLLLHLEEPTEGAIKFKGKAYDGFSNDELADFRSSVHAVFQDPFSSLNPRMRAWELITEPLIVNTKLSKSEIRERASELLEIVQLGPRSANLYPHEFSGGQRQRIALARAMSLPSISMIVLDEPVASLDVSIGAQILNLLKDLREQRALTYLLISHNLGMVRYMSDRVGVMYLGHIVEEANASELFERPLHPYSKLLMQSAQPATVAETGEWDNVDIGEVPSTLDIPSGCAFHPRCPYAMDICKDKVPTLTQVEVGRKVACHLY